MPPLKTFSFALVVSALVVSVLSSVPSGQGRPSTPPGQVNRPPTPAGQGTGHPQTPAGQARVAAPLVVKPKLVQRLQPLLPREVLVIQAAQGFKNLGAFVSAVHVSHNLDIPFATLKMKVVTDGLNLGNAIRALKPTADANAEVKRAEKQAADDIAAASAP